MVFYKLACEIERTFVVDVFCLSLGVFAPFLPWSGVMRRGVMRCLGRVLISS